MNDDALEDIFINFLFEYLLTKPREVIIHKHTKPYPNKKNLSHFSIRFSFFLKGSRPRGSEEGSSLRVPCETNGGQRDRVGNAQHTRYLPRIQEGHCDAEERTLETHTPRKGSTKKKEEGRKKKKKPVTNAVESDVTQKCMYSFHCG